MNHHTQIVLDLLDEHGPRLHALLLRITLSPEAAEDLLQDLFLRLNRQGTFASIRDPLGYAVRTATRLAFDWRRSYRRRRDGEALTEDPAAREGCEPNQLEFREDLQAVLHSIAQLSEASREVVVLRYLEGETYEAIAEQLNKTPHQVRALCQKGVLRLRQLSGANDSAATTTGRN